MYWVASQHDVVRLYEKRKEVFIFVTFFKLIIKLPANGDGDDTKAIVWLPDGSWVKNEVLVMLVVVLMVVMTCLAVLVGKEEEDLTPASSEFFSSRKKFEIRDNSVDR